MLFIRYLPLPTHTPRTHTHIHTPRTHERTDSRTHECTDSRTDSRTHASCILMSWLWRNAVTQHFYLQASLGAVGRDNQNAGRINTSADKRVDVVMTQLSHLPKKRKQNTPHNFCNKQDIVFTHRGHQLTARQSSDQWEAGKSMMHVIVGSSLDISLSASLTAVKMYVHRAHLHTMTTH